MDKRYRNILISIIVALLGYFAAGFVFDATQSRLIGVVILLVALWSNEALPFGIVSLFPIILFPTLDILTMPMTSANYSKTIIFLFLGGFMIAIAIEKTQLHKKIAHKLLSIFPDSARGMIYALSITSALLSSLLSNTTTALLLMPIALFLTDIKKLKMRLALAIAYGASIGGIMTPVGTPPNLILMGFLEEHSIETLSFFAWMLKTVPLAALMLLLIPYILSLGMGKIVIADVADTSHTLNTEQNRLKNILFLLITLLFVNSFFKISDTIILLSFGLAMFLPKIGFLEWEDTKKIPYEIIFLFGAGFSIAAAFSHSGLAKEISQMLLSLTQLSPIFLFLIVASLVTFATELTSNMALISIALPIIYSLGIASNIDTNTLLMVATICASYAFMLPIATAPNAIAMSSRAVSVKDMASFGIIFNIVAIIMTTTIAFLIW